MTNRMLLTRSGNRSGIRVWRRFLPLSILVACAAWPALAAEEKAAASIQAVEEERVCMGNLKLIYEAIQKYQTDHKDLPNWLSDLVPKYIADANILVCPVCRRTGRTEGPPLADPKISSSYLFEFCPVPLGGEAPKAPNRTRRDWKRRQMGLVGSAVPLVRCRHHDPVLNLAFDGKIYESPPMWELAFTNRISAALLTPAKIFEDEPAERNANPGTRTFPARDLNARNELLDLTGFYNALLSDSWHGNTGNDLGALPAGLQTLAGVEFDIRGIIQLAGRAAIVTNWPTQVRGIPVRQKCQRLHFLHSAGHGKSSDDGKQIGSYIVHFATNRMQLEIPIYYGRDVRDWHLSPNDIDSLKGMTIAWKGENAVSRRAGNSICLFQTTWTNLVPSVEIDTLDFVSALEGPAPFLIAVTTE